MTGTLQDGSTLGPAQIAGPGSSLLGVDQYGYATRFTMASVATQIGGSGGGSGITQLTGDGTTPPNSSGSTAFTLATVNSTIGTYTKVVVNGKGLVTQGLALTLADIPQGGATLTQALTWNGTAWAPTTISGSTSGSIFTVYLSRNGILSDAVNGIDYSSTAPLGVTGQEAAINALLASSVAAAAAAGAAGIEIVWDVAVALGGPIYLYSNMTVRAPSFAHGAIIRTNAACPIFRLKGMEADQTQTANTQKSFGKYDPAHSGDTRYRVFDPAFVNAVNVSIIGGTWNGNSPQQSTTGTFYWSPQWGPISVFSFWGVSGLTIKNVRVFLAMGYATHYVNFSDVTIEDADIDQHFVSAKYNDDCFHFNGPGTRININRIRTHCGDDNLALNGDDGNSVGPLVSGVNWVCSGAIITIRVSNMLIWRGREDVQGWGAIRLLSNVARIDDVIIRAVSGTTDSHAVTMMLWPDALVLGTGNIGHVTFEDFNLKLLGTGPSGGTATFQTDSQHIECLEIRNRFLSNAGSLPDIRLHSGANVQAIKLSGEWYQPVGATNNVPIIQLDGTVQMLSFTGRTYRDSSLAAGTAPVLQVGTGTIAQDAFIDVDAHKIINIVNITAGSHGTLALRGAHRAAVGGSPLAIASGATLANYIYGTGVYPLAYAHALVGASSGSGTVTHANDYVETSSALLLDAITATVKGAYSVRKLRGAYGGACIQVRRSFDNTTQDIGFTSGNDIDTLALVAFAGSGNAFVSIWYDQSGNAQNLTQATNAAQPQIVSGGNILPLNSKPGIKFSSPVAATSLSKSGFAAGSAPATFAASIVAARTASAGGAARLLSFTATGESNDYTTTNSMMMGLSQSSGFGAGQNNAWLSHNGSNPGTTAFQYFIINNGTQNQIFLDGTAATAVANVSTLAATGHLDISSLNGVTTDTTAWDGPISELIFISGALSGPDQTTIRSSETSYFGTP